MLDLSRYAFSGKDRYPYSADSLPFAARVSTPPLRCLLDPEAHLGPVDRAYVDLLGSSSTDRTGIDITIFQMKDHRGADEGRWHVAEQSGQTYLFKRITPAGTNGAIARGVRHCV